MFALIENVAPKFGPVYFCEYPFWRVAEVCLLEPYVVFQPQNK